MCLYILGGKSSCTTCCLKPTELFLERAQPANLTQSCKANGITTYRHQRGSIDRKQARSCNHYKFETAVFENPHKCSFIELTKQGSCFEDPNTRVFLGGHFDGDNEVGGLTSGTEHTSTY